MQTLLILATVQSNVDKPRPLPSQNQRGPSCSCISCAMWSTLASYLPGSLTDTLPLCFHNPSEIKVLRMRNKSVREICKKVRIILYKMWNCHDYVHKRKPANYAFKYCRILTNWLVQINRSESDRNLKFSFLKI